MITWEEDRCASVGMCEAVAPLLFRIGDDGALRVLEPCPGSEHRALVTEAVDACPTGALGVQG